MLETYQWALGEPHVCQKAVHSTVGGLMWALQLACFPIDDSTTTVVMSYTQTYQVTHTNLQVTSGLSRPFPALRVFHVAYDVGAVGFV